MIKQLFELKILFRWNHTNNVPQIFIESRHEAQLRNQVNGLIVTPVQIALRRSYNQQRLRVAFNYLIVTSSIVIHVRDVALLFLQVKRRPWSFVEVDIVDPVCLVIVAGHHHLAQQIILAFGLQNTKAVYSGRKIENEKRYEMTYAEFSNVEFSTNPVHNHEGCFTTQILVQNVHV